MFVIKLADGRTIISQNLPTDDVVGSLLTYWNDESSVIAITATKTKADHRVAMVVLNPPPIEVDGEPTPQAPGTVTLSNDNATIVLKDHAGATVAEFPGNVRYPFPTDSQ